MNELHLLGGIEPKGLKETLDNLLAGKDSPEIAKLQKDLADAGTGDDSHSIYQRMLFKGRLEEKLRESFYEALKAARPGERFEDAVFNRDHVYVSAPSMKQRVVDRLDKAEGFIKDVVHPERLKQAGESKVFVGETPIRANYRAPNKAIMLDMWTDTEITVHEFGHHLQAMDLNGIMESEKAFLRKRAGPNPKLLVINGMENEVGFKDDFAAKGGSDYAGKIYGDFKKANGEYEWTVGEVTSMGIQRLYANPVAFLRDDPEFFHWTVDNIQKAP